MKTELHTFVLFLLPLMTWCYSWHSSVYEFENMLKEDLFILRSLDRYVSKERESLNTFETILGSVSNKLEKQIMNLERDFHHPISYLRFIEVFKDIANISLSKTKNDVGVINVFGKLLLHPTKADRVAVLENLINLQKAYELRTEDLVNGNLSKYDSKFNAKHKLTADDCIAMGILAGQRDDYELQLEWYKEALKMEDNTSVNSVEIIATAIEDVEAKMSCKRLCRSGQQVTLNNKELKCIMWNNYQDPWLILQPVKMEFLANAPDIVRFYDVISDEEIKVLKRSCRYNLKNAQTINHEDTVTLKSARVAHNCWLDETKYDIALRLNNRIQHITGLDMENAEILQVANYGIGGHYVPHKDADNGHRYDRTATFMFYLSDVQYGGATAFVSPGVAVKPLKGSAVFWYNLLPSGEVDDRTTHCACEVILGNKWIANKWIHPSSNAVCRKNENIG